MVHGSRYYLEVSREWLGSSLCNMSGGLQMIDRQVLCGRHVVRQKDPTCSKAFLPVI